MKVAYFDCFSGISGDMLLGSLVDAGLSLKKLTKELKKLNIEGFHLEEREVVKNGIAGTKVDVVVDTQEQVHRHLKDIFAILEKSDLKEDIKEKCKAIFTRLAEAEAKVHNTTIEKIHFHEVGALDAIVDVAGTVIGLDLLGIEKIYASPLHVGRGFTKCAHGIIPITAPATLELLKNVPIYSTGIEKELVTPTGAAIITTLCDNFGNIPLMTLKAGGYGAGTRDLEIPNFLRVMIGDLEKGPSKGPVRFKDKTEERIENSLMVEVNIDDMNPEFYDYLFEKLFLAGAQDVFIEQILMKKNRPANILKILVDTANFEKIKNIIFTETTTIGFRVYPVTKYMLPYEIKDISTRYGSTKVKVSYYRGKSTTFSPEYEDLKKHAEKFGEPLKNIYFQAITDIKKTLK